VPELRAVISDFGGVLTTPLQAAFADTSESGIALADYGRALALTTPPGGEPSLFALERGEIPETEFVAEMERGLTEVLGRPVSLDGFAARLHAALKPNRAMFEHYRTLRDDGLRLALLTNNVREWESAWRSLLPIDEVFELVIDSSAVGLRKPDPAIYTLTLDRLGLPADACAFVDDLEINVDAARDLGLHGVVFRDTEQVIAELGALRAGQFSQPSRSQQ
jgi:putative hydrolase of the HAD superfamily